MASKFYHEMLKMNIVIPTIQLIQGEYEIYLYAWVSGQYVPISNTVKYTIHELW